MKHFYTPKFRWLVLSVIVLCSLQVSAQYCTAAFPYNEPITSVIFAGINNTTPADPEESDSYIDYTGISGTVYRQLEYTIQIQGNTGEDGWGPYSDYVRIFIDWNQNGTFDTGESYDMPTPLTGSSGEDGQEISYTFTVPASAALGTTTMRIVKRYSAYGTACPTSGFGQIQDYSLTVNAEPSCMPPATMNISAIGSGTATLNWTASTSTGATGYQYYISTLNVAPDASTVWVDATGTASTPLTALNSNMQYFVWMRTKCGATFSPWGSSVTFTTTCVASSAPFFEDFEGGALPSCWTTTSSNATAASGTGIWIFAGAAGYAAGNTSAAGTYAWVDGSDPSDIANVTLITPPVNLAGLTVPEITFDYFSNNSGTYPNNIFSVAIYNGTTWTNIYTNNTSQSSWRTIALQLPSYAGTTVQFRFVVDKTAAPLGNAYLNDILLDNISVHEAPVCIAPTAVNATSVTKFGATINWTASSIAPSNNYDIYYSTDPTAPGSGTAANGGTAVTTGAVLSGLTSSTNYYVWVRGNCGTNGGSAWTPVATFTTLCDYPVITTATGATACGQGAVTLTGVPSAGQLYWWSAETGGNYLGSGNTYTTPVLTQTTTYYVAAASPVPNVTTSIGAGTQTSTSAGYSPYYHGYGGNKTQYLIRASELQLAGVSPGPITSLTYTITTLGTDTFQDFAISMGATEQNVMTATQVDGLSLVYSSASQSLMMGDNTYEFDMPFVWDGQSNIVVQTCYSNNNYGGTSSAVRYHSPGFASATYSYADNQTADVICAIVDANDVGYTYSGTIRPNFKINSTALCSSPRQAVIATISTADTVNATASDNDICAGDSTTLSVTSSNADYTYVWMPGNLTGATQSVTPAATTTYTVTATDSGTNCVTTATVTVTVNAVPTAITVTPATAQLCTNTPVALTVSGASASGNAAMGTGTTAPGTTSHPNPFNAWFGGSKIQMLYMASELQAQGVVVGSSITSITFDFAASINRTANDLRIRIGSTTNDNTTAGFVPLNTLTEVYTNAAYTPVTGAVGPVTFTFIAPYIWDGNNIIVEVVHNQGNTGNGAGTTTIATTTSYNSVYYLAKDGVTPAGAASFDALTPTTWIGPGTYNVGTSTSRPNIVFAYNLSNPVTWSPVAGLFTDAAGSTAYTGQAATTVYAMPATATTYVATATNAAGCIATDDAVITPGAANTPTGAASQAISVNSAAEATIEAIVVAETGVKWFATEAQAIAGTPALPAGTALAVGTTYYGTLATGSCVPLAVLITDILGSKGFNKSQFTYYPNPVKDVLNLKYSNNISSVEVYNLLGQVIISKKVDATETVVDMSRIADGNYIVRVSSADSVEILKIVKKQ